MNFVYQQVYSQNNRRLTQYQSSQQLQALIKIGLQKNTFTKQLKQNNSRLIVKQQGSFDNLGSANLSPEDVVSGGIYDGLVERIERYGVFVNIGLQRAGLVHISEVASQYTSGEELLQKYPIGTAVQVLVLNVDRVKGSLQLSIKRCDPNYQDRPRGPPRQASENGNSDRDGFVRSAPRDQTTQPRKRFGERKEVIMSLEELQQGQEVQGRVVGRINIGYFISFGCEKDGMLYEQYVDQELQIDEELTCYIQDVNTTRQQVRIVLDPEQVSQQSREQDSGSFVDDGQARPRKGVYRRDRNVSLDQEPAEDKYAPNTLVRGTISRVMGSAVMVNVQDEGYRFMLPREPEGEGQISSESIYQEGQVIEAYVVRAVGNKVDLTLKSKQERDEEKKLEKHGISINQERMKSPLGSRLAMLGIKLKKSKEQIHAAKGSSTQGIAPANQAEPQLQHQEDKAKQQVENEPQQKPEAEQKQKQESEALLQAEAEVKQVSEAEAEQVSEAEVKQVSEAEATQVSEAEAQQVSEAEAKQVSEAEAKSKAEDEARVKIEAEAKQKAEFEAKQQAETEANQQAVAEAKLKEEAEAKLTAEVEAQREVEARQKIENETRMNDEAQRIASSEAQLKQKAEAKQKQEDESQKQKAAEATLQQESKANNAQETSSTQQQKEEGMSQASHQNIQVSSSPPSTSTDEQITFNSSGSLQGLITHYIHAGGRQGSLVEINCKSEETATSEEFKKFASMIAMQIIAYPNVVCVNTTDIPQEIIQKEKAIEMQRADILQKPENMREKIVEGRLGKYKKELALLEQPNLENSDQTIKASIQAESTKLKDQITVRRFERYNLGEGLEKKSENFADEVAKQTGAQKQDNIQEKPKEEPQVVQPQQEQNQLEQPDPNFKVSAKEVGSLRAITQAGMQDCKKALQAVQGDFDKAQDWLRKKGITSATKKASRKATEGVVSAMQDKNQGLIIEVNCETDFVSKGDEFKALAKSIGESALSSNIQYVSLEDVPKDIADTKGDSIKESILLLQPSKQDSSKTIEEVVREAVARLGENIKVRRFVKYTLGEEM